MDIFVCGKTKSVGVCVHVHVSVAYMYLRSVLHVAIYNVRSTYSGAQLESVKSGCDRKLSQLYKWACFELASRWLYLSSP